MIPQPNPPQHGKDPMLLRVMGKMNTVIDICMNPCSFHKLRVLRSADSVILSKTAKKAAALRNLSSMGLDHSVSLCERLGYLCELGEWPRHESTAISATM